MAAAVEAAQQVLDPSATADMLGPLMQLLPAAAPSCTAMQTLDQQAGAADWRCMLDAGLRARVAWLVDKARDGGGSSAGANHGASQVDRSGQRLQRLQNDVCSAERCLADARATGTEGFAAMAQRLLSESQRAMTAEEEEQQALAKARALLAGERERAAQASKALDLLLPLASCADELQVRAMWKSRPPAIHYCDIQLLSTSEACRGKHAWRQSTSQSPTA